MSSGTQAGIYFGESRWPEPVAGGPAAASFLRGIRPIAAGAEGEMHAAGPTAGGSVVVVSLLLCGGLLPLLALALSAALAAGRVAAAAAAAAARLLVAVARLLVAVALGMQLAGYLFVVDKGG